jgi:glycosyltransferase involved in cell wall biosynthesis
MRLGLYSHAPLENYGGGEVTSILLANWFATHGWQVSVRSEDAYAGPRRLSSEEVRGLLDPRVLRGTMPFADRKFAGFPSIWRSTLPPVDELRGDDVSLFLLPTVPDRRYLQELVARGSRAMFLLHALTVDQPFPWRRRILWDEMLHRLSLYGLRGLPPTPRLLFQVLNDRSAQLLRWHGVPPEQVRLIPTGIDFGRYAVHDDGGRFRVAFVGRIHDPWKGIDRLQRTVARVLATSPGPVEFVIMGSGPDAERLRRWAEGRSAVRYLGFVPLEEKVRELGACSAMVSTSGSEPYGLTSLEGFASGLPLVATPTAGSSYLVRQGSGFGTVASYSPSDLARRLLAYRAAWAADRPGYAAARTARRDAARQLFDLPGMFGRYEHCLRDLTDGVAGPGPSGQGR